MIQLKDDLFQKDKLLGISKTAWKNKTAIVNLEIDEIRQISLSKNAFLNNLKSKNEGLEKKLLSVFNTNQQLTSKSEKLKIKIDEEQTVEILWDHLVKLGWKPINGEKDSSNKKECLLKMDWGIPK